MALCLVLLLVVAAVALDGGLLLMDRRRAQSVADAAALAAAANLYTNFPTNQGTDPSGTAKSAALAYAAANGYSNDGVTSTVTVNIPPTSGDHAGVAGYAEVIVQYNQTRGFSNVLGAGALAVKARAVARGLQTAYSKAGALLLDSSGSGSFNANNCSLTVAGGAPVVVGSNSSTAMTLSGQSTLTASAINLTGNYALTNNSSIQGAVNTGVAAPSDPLSKLAVPNAATLATQSSSALTYSSGSHTLQPGVYTGGLTVSGSATVTLQPGVYYLDGGGVNVNTGGSLIGQGVMIYNNPHAGTDTITASGPGTLTLSPPTSGLYQGMTLFQSRSSTNPINLPAQSNTTITGTLYAPSARLAFNGPGSNAIASQIITSDLMIQGGGALTLTWDAGKVARIHDVRLTE